MSVDSRGRVDAALAATLTSEVAAVAVDGRASPAPPATSTPVTAGAGRYEIGRELGRGGMGRVLEATDRQFNRTVAVKELIDVSSAERRQRFATEALVTGNLEHPGIPAVHERGTSDAGTPYYVMRRVAGRTLAALLADARSLEDRLALLPAVVKTAQALGYAHERGVIHRDVKPDNVIVGPYGDVVLLDWGIARVRGVATTADMGSDAATGAAAASTVYGSVVGTPLYMAPEQAAGETDRIDERTDVFALGALLYHVLSGRPPYGGPTVEVVLDAAKRGVRDPVRGTARGIPEELATVCERAMARDPAARYRSAADFAAALEGLQARALLSRPSRVLTAVVEALVAITVVGFAAAIVNVLRMLPELWQMGPGAYVNAVVGSLGLFFGAVDWWSRGRMRLGPVVLALAGVSFLSGVVVTAAGLGIVFARLGDAELAADAVRYRELLGAGVWEAMGALALGAALAGLQLVVWALARRRALAETGSTAAAGRG